MDRMCHRRGRKGKHPNVCAESAVPRPAPPCHPVVIDAIHQIRAIRPRPTLGFAGIG